MSPHEKKGNTRMPIPKQKFNHNPIPTSLFVFDIYLLFLDENNVGTIDSF